MKVIAAFRRDSRTAFKALFKHYLRRALNVVGIEELQRALAGRAGRAAAGG